MPRRSIPLWSKKRWSSTATIACRMIGAMSSVLDEDAALVAAQHREHGAAVRRVHDRVHLGALARPGSSAGISLATARTRPK